MLTVQKELVWLTAIVLGVLVLATLVGQILRRTAGRQSKDRHAEPGQAAEFIGNLNARIKAWWAMVAVFGLALATGGVGSVLLFALTSFGALREFLTLAPTKRADHRALFWTFFVFVPLQYWLVFTEWYGLFIILIPVYAFLFLPARIALAGETRDFLQRSAVIQWGLMICVYCVSHAPALLMLEPRGEEGAGPTLLFFLVLVVQMSDVLQYVFGKLLGRRRIAPHVSPGKTWEGFLGGVATATALGAGLWWATPFRPWEAAALSLMICLLGFFGGLVLSSIKRDRGVKDWGSMIQGHGGILDRIDSLLFAAPIFFHVVRYYG